MPTISQHQKKALSGPQYVLKLVDHNFYVAEKQGMTGCRLTDRIEDAEKYSVEYDDQDRKLRIWQAIARMKFEVVYLLPITH